MIFRKLPGKSFKRPGGTAERTRPDWRDAVKVLHSIYEFYSTDWLHIYVPCANNGIILPRLCLHKIKFSGSYIFKSFRIFLCVQTSHLSLNYL